MFKVIRKEIIDGGYERYWVGVRRLDFGFDLELERVIIG